MAHTCQHYCMTFTLVLFVTAVTSKIFTSTAKLKTLPSMERSLLSALQLYLQNDESSNHTTILERFLVQSDLECRKAEEDEHYMENPINAFHVIRRLVKDWGDVMTLIRPTNNLAKVFRDTTKNTTLSSLWPDNKDLQGSMVAIVRLAYIYDLDIGNVSQGLIKDTVTSALSPRDLVMIGDRCIKERLIYDAIQFYNEALNIMAASRYDKAQHDWPRKMDTLLGRKHLTLTTYAIVRKISSTYHNFGYLSLAKDTLENALGLAWSRNQKHELQNDINYYDSVMSDSTRTEAVFQRPPHTNPEDWWESYIGLCKNPPLRNSSPVLSCEFWDTSIPIYKVKAEYASRDPEIIIFYDVIHEDEIQWLKTNSVDLLYRSGGKTQTPNTKIKERISESAWHDDSKTEQLLHLNHRVHLITDMNVSVTYADTPSENLQVLNYGLGGMYEPHYDAYYDMTGGNPNVKFRHAGDRIATFAFYLTDVLHGGATVFPKLGLKVEPVKGSASFWWNLYRNGTKDARLLHAGCPILIGEKWLANKWIREAAQMWVRPCAVTPTL